jgi:hypothetical protein
MKAVLIDCDDCGHCIDVGTPVETDPIQVIEAREGIYEQIVIWLNEADNKNIIA